VSACSVEDGDADPRRLADARVLDALTRVSPLARRSLPIDTIAMARYLIGKLVVHDAPDGRMSGRIVETEAYPVGDSTSYAFRGETAHNAALFGVRGHAHIQLVYGVSYTLNVASEADGTGAGVLIRAIEPVAGIELMQRRRPGVKHVDLARGPGRLAAAMDIDARFHGMDLCAGHALWLGVRRGGAASVGVTTRIGLSRETHRKLRFYERGSPLVSGPRRLLRPVRREA
jgi:DNA-3-methyladenine glycosylase